MPEPQSLVRTESTLPARVEVREDVKLVMQTKSQRRWVMGLMSAGMFSLVNLMSSSAVVAAILGGLLGLSVSKVRTLGRRRLLRLVAQLEQPSNRVHALEGLAHLATKARAVTTSVRVEAAGHVALGRIETGDLDAALAVMRAAYVDAGAVERQRLPDQGFLGETVHSLLGRLVPGSMADVVPVAAIVSEAAATRVPHADQPWVAALVRSLEALAASRPTTARNSWLEAIADPRGSMHPHALALVGAALHEGSVELDDGGTALLELLDKLDDRGRTMVETQFPRVRELGQQGYRIDAGSEARSLAVIPRALRGLAVGSPPTRWLPVTTRTNRTALGISGGMMVLFAATFFALGDPAMGLAGAFFAAALGPSLAGRIVHRRRRLHTLTRAGVVTSTDDPRYEELDLMPARLGPAKNDSATLYPLDATELQLLVALKHAETELEDGDAEAAETWVKWWLDVAAEQGFGDIALLAVAASALRVAVLVGHAAAAAKLEKGLRTRKRSDPRIPKFPKRRSAAGDAPRAVEFARALFYARSGDWAGAASLLNRANGLPPIELTDFDRRLYAGLARAVHAEGHAVPRGLRRLDQDLDSTDDRLGRVWAALRSTVDA